LSIITLLIEQKVKSFFNIKYNRSVYLVLLRVFILKIKKKDMVAANNNNKIALNPSAPWIPITEPIKPVVTPLNVFNPRKDI